MATRIALIGAGNIAATHAEVIRGQPDLHLVGFVDPAEGRAAAMAGRFGGAGFRDFDSLAAGGGCDVAHILVPPPLHAKVAHAALDAGYGVFLEKPMAETTADCTALLEAAARHGAPIGVNQNFAYHPALLRALEAMARGEIGPLRHVTCHYHMPLRQLAAGQFGHWMFAEPRNLLLEQAVHPLSQIDRLIGPITDFTLSPRPLQDCGGGLMLQTEWLASLVSAKATASLSLRLGSAYPVWRLTVIGEDGTLEIDTVQDRMVPSLPSQWPDFWDQRATAVASAQALRRDAGRNTADFFKSLFKLQPRSDAFFRSMQASMRAFYDAIGSDLDNAEPPAARGARLVALCAEMAAALPDTAAASPPQPLRPAADRRFDVLLIGGTGFIGRHTTEALLEAGHSVAVAGRNIDRLPAVFHRPEVGVFQGDVGRIDSLTDAIAQSNAVVNLAQGAAGESWPEIRDSVVESSLAVARAAQAAGCARLVHLSSIAALYCGDPADSITDQTPPDPHGHKRAPYGRAKGEAEKALWREVEASGLPTVILRPGLVVGAGTPPMHSGLGFANREQHVIGWNDGNNPLPWVLAEDVASAIFAALTAEDAPGHSFNLVGDVRPTARTYIAWARDTLGRPFTFHPQSVAWLWTAELAKYGVKLVIGRPAAFPYAADIRSRGLLARFDTSAEKRILNWQPESDEARFIDRALAVHRRS